MNKLTALILLGTVATVMADDHATTVNFISSDTVNYSGTFSWDEDHTTLYTTLTLTGVTAASRNNGFWMGYIFDSTTSAERYDANGCKAIWSTGTTGYCTCYDFSYAVDTSSGTAVYTANFSESDNVYLNSTLTVTGTNSLDTWSCSFSRSFSVSDSEKEAGTDYEIMAGKATPAPPVARAR